MRQAGETPLSWLKTRLPPRQPASAGRESEWLRSQPWKDAAIPPDVRSVPTMLSVEERQLLFVLARDYVRGDGAIIDAGCFIGGSTISLACGLAENPGAADAGPIHAFDLFQLDGAYKHAYPGLVEGIEVGESMRPRFEELLGSRIEYVSAHEGDIRQVCWADRPVELLFIDICKSWDINDHVIREFFPALVPGRSVVIQQDLIHEWLPFLTITMGLFEDSFELVGVAPPCSAIYLHTRAIPRRAIPHALDELSAGRKVELFDRGCAPFTGEDRAVIECSRAVLLVNLGRPIDAVAHLATIVAEFPGSDRVQYIGQAISQWLEPRLGGRP